MTEVIVVCQSRAGEVALQIFPVKAPVEGREDQALGPWAVPSVDVEGDLGATSIP